MRLLLTKNLRGFSMERMSVRQRYVIRMVHMPDCPNPYDMSEWSTIGWGD